MVVDAEIFWLWPNAQSAISIYQFYSIDSGLINFIYYCSLFLVEERWLCDIYLPEHEQWNDV